ncbi:MAG: DNA-packaging protein, partial [Treponema sp.]|nr:DNA-packaging protein [Treponema sp.]
YQLILELCGHYNYQLRYREAIELYNRADSLHPEDPEIRRNVRRQRAPRFLNTLQFAKAEADFLFCEAHKPGTLDIAYRLGLTCYMMGRRSEAADWFARAREYARSGSDGEMEAAALYWQILTAASLRETFGPWLTFDFTRNIDHHWAYRNTIKFFYDAFGPGGICEGGLKGGLGKQAAEKLSPRRREALLNAAAGLYRPPAPEDDEEQTMNGTILNYGVYRFYRYLGETDRAAETFKVILEHDAFWPCYAYLAAWTDRGEPAGNVC